MSSSLQTWPAPAKLNLFLHITGQRLDGYHELQTIFQFIDLQDKLSFQYHSDGDIVCHADLPGVAVQDNLIWRAAQLLKKTANTTQGADIWLKKNIPSGGGLGGGSSDAATTLLALNQLWQLHYSSQQLAELGLSLGADVPIFIHGKAAWAEGVGEQFYPIDQMDTPWYCVLRPACEVSTQTVFQHSQLTRDSKTIKMRRFVELDTLFAHTSNDCQAVVCQEYPVIQQAIDNLSRFSKARLTGTGACIFAAFPTQQAAQQALNQCSERTWQGWIVQSLNTSPVLQKLL